MLRSVAALALFLTACEFGVGGTDGGAPPADLAPSPPVASVTSAADLVGFATTFDASGSTDPAGRALSFAWHLAAAPAGSTITDASLSSTSAARISFEPDLGGDYALQLTLIADSDRTLLTTTVTVPTVPIFFQEGDFTATTEHVAVGVMRSDGSGKHLVSCLSTSDAGSADLPGFAFNTFHGVGAYDPPVGMGPGRFAFTLAQGAQHALFVADEASDCASRAPPRVDESTGFYSGHGHFWPRFSPDGSRVLWVDNPESQMPGQAGTSRLVSASIDGLNVRVIRGASTAVNLATAPPFWIDATHVGWVEDTGTGMSPRPIVFTASDAGAAGDSTTAPGDRAVVADCSTTLPIVNEVLRLPDGSLLVAGGTMLKKNGGALGLYRVTGPGCTIAATLMNEPAGGDAGDFSLSPDGKTVLVSSTHGQTNDGGPMQHDLFVVPADGSQPAKLFAGSPTVDDLGPRFIAGGRQVLWTQGSQAADGSVAGGGLMIADADGTHVRSLQAESSATVVIAGSNSGLSCAWAGPAGGASATVLVLLALLAILTRRSAGRRGPGPW